MSEELCRNGYGVLDKKRILEGLHLQDTVSGVANVIVGLVAVLVGSDYSIRFPGCSPDKVYEILWALKGDGEAWSRVMTSETITVRKRLGRLLSFAMSNGMLREDLDLMKILSHAIHDYQYNMCHVAVYLHTLKARLYGQSLL